jgi:hypothetical protein
MPHICSTYIKFDRLKMMKAAHLQKRLVCYNTALKKKILGSSFLSNAYLSEMMVLLVSQEFS